MRPMRLAYVSWLTPHDRAGLSGTPFYMLRALRASGLDVVVLEPPHLRALGFAELSLMRASRRVLPANREYHLGTLAALRYGHAMSRTLLQHSVDAVFAPMAWRITAFLKTKLPIISTSDHTWRQYYKYYASEWVRYWLTPRERDVLERLATRKSRLLVYPSEWAATSAIQDYGAPAQRVHVVPYGANIDAAPPAHVALRRSSQRECRLLFLGVGWERKGGPLAVRTLQELRSSGVNAELIVCGSTPPPSSLVDGVTVIPFLSKDVPQDRARLDELLRTSHFLLLPTRAECYGLVFCEASAFGLPSITTDTGGVAGAVTNGVNGFRLPIDAGAEEYAALIRRFVEDEAAYRQLTASSRKVFEERLNWDAWGRSVRQLAEEMVRMHAD